MTEEDLYLLCDLFYLPFEHGARGLKLLVEFNWLKANANVLLNKQLNTENNAPPKPEVNTRKTGIENIAKCSRWLYNSQNI